MADTFAVTELIGKPNALNPSVDFRVTLNVRELRQPSREGEVYYDRQLVYYNAQNAFACRLECTMPSPICGGPKAEGGPLPSRRSVAAAKRPSKAESYRNLLNSLILLW